MVQQVRHGEEEMSRQNSLWMKERKIGLAAEFYNRVHHLYSNYELWRRVYYKDTDSSNFYAKTPVDECKDILPDG